MRTPGEVVAVVEAGQRAGRSGTKSFTADDVAVLVCCATLGLAVMQDGLKPWIKRSARGCLGRFAEQRGASHWAGPCHRGRPCGRVGTATRTVTTGSAQRSCRMILLVGSALSLGALQVA